MWIFVWLCNFYSVLWERTCVSVCVRECVFMYVSIGVLCVYVREGKKDSSYMIGKIFYFIILLLFFPLSKQSLCW